MPAPGGAQQGTRTCRPEATDARPRTRHQATHAAGQTCPAPRHPPNSTRSTPDPTLLDSQQSPRHRSALGGKACHGEVACPATEMADHRCPQGAAASNGLPTRIACAHSRVCRPPGPRPTGRPASTTEAGRWRAGLSRSGVEGTGAKAHVRRRVSRASPPGSVTSDPSGRGGSPSVGMSELDAQHSVARVSWALDGTARLGWLAVMSGDVVPRGSGGCGSNA